MRYNKESDMVRRIKIQALFSLLFIQLESDTYKNRMKQPNKPNDSNKKKKSD